MSDSQTKVSVYQQGRLIREHVLPPGDYVIKGDGDAETFVPGQAPEGPKLHLNGEQRLVEDLGSMDGTVIDDRNISEPTVIMSGQMIRCGDREIVVAWGAASSSAEETRPEVVVRQPTVDEIRTSPRYGTMRNLNRGGMGLIMTARDAILHREVVVKFMRDPSRPESVARFYQEAQITAQLEHPNIVPVHELALNEHDQPFYTMKRVRGLSLKKVLEGLANNDAEIIRLWPLSALLTVFQKVCDAMAFSHAAGVIHRDLKPDNIMLGEYGEAQVMDWGLAKVFGHGAHTGVFTQVPAAAGDSTVSPDRSTMGGTMSGTIIGTPQYMPPEQARGEVESLDERADIYALGAILYHILALRPPFQGRGHDEVLGNVRQGRVIPFAEAVANRELPHLPGGRVPASLAAVCRKAMAFDRQQRYPAVKILQSEIEACQTGFAPAAEDAGLVKLATLFFRRHRTVSLAVVALFVAGVIFAFNLKRERDRATVASAQAETERNEAEDQLYLSEMLQAGRDLEDGRPQSARDLLARHRVETSGRDLRGWEWYYLLGEANQDRLRVHAHNGGVFAIAAAADGARLATGGGDGEIAVWQARGLAPQFRFRAFPGTVLTLDWHPGGKWLAAGSADGLIRVWDAETQKSVAEFQFPSESPVRTVRWRPEVSGPPTLVMGGEGTEVLSWQPLESSQAAGPQFFCKTRGRVAALHWSGDGRRLAIGELGTTETIEVFDYASRGRVFVTNAISGTEVFAVAMDPQGKYVAAGSKHLVVAIHDIEKPEAIFSDALHSGFVSSLAWSPAGEFLASASHDGTIRLVSRADRAAVQILSGHRGEINALAWIRLASGEGEGRRSAALFSGGADGTLRAWSAPAGRAFTVKDSNWISASNWNPEGTRIAVANFRDNLHVADPATGQCVRIHAVRGAIFDAVWSPDGTRLATASRYHHCVETFEAASGRPLGTLHLPSAYRVAWSPTGRYLAACGREGARVWDAATGALLVRLSRPSGSIVWHPDERRIILGGENGAIELWDAFAGKLSATWRPASMVKATILASETEPPHQVFDLRWSRDQKYLAFSTQDSAAGVLDGRDGRLVHSFAGHNSGVWRVAWDREGRRVATAGQDGVLRIFDMRTGGQVAQINHGRENAELHGLDWDRDGRCMVSGGFDRFVRLWDAGRGEQIDAIEKLAAEAKARPKVESLQALARAYTGLGAVDEARETWRAAQALAPDDAGLKTGVAQMEAQLARAMDMVFFANDRLVDRPIDAMTLVNAIHDSWAVGKAEDAVKAWRELRRLPDAEKYLPLARTHLSRARWQAVWFPFKADPVASPDQWRQEAKGLDGVPVNVALLSFPYRRGGPKDLFLESGLIERGPGGKNFGMIATARVNLAAGKWRLRVVGDGGARVLVAGKPVLEKLGKDAPAEQSVVFEQAAAEAFEITVEHFVRDGADGFQFTIEPVDE